MTAEATSPIPEPMREAERRLADMRAEIRAMNRRHPEEGQALFDHRLDRADGRISRIERRLDLVEG